MGIKVASVKLFINDSEDIFKSDFICEIKYFEDIETIDNILSIKNWEDYYRFQGLYSLFLEGDGIEIIKKDNIIYRIDTTDSFILSSLFISYLAYDFNKFGVNVKEFVERKIMDIAKLSYDTTILQWEAYKKVFLKKHDSKYLKYFLEPFYLLDTIEDEFIEEIISNLNYFYPNIVGDYYREFFKNLRGYVKEFLNEC